MAIQVKGNIKYGIGLITDPFLFIVAHTKGKRHVTIDLQIYSDKTMQERGGGIGIEDIEVDFLSPEVFKEIHSKVIEKLKEQYPDTTFEIIGLT